MEGENKGERPAPSPPLTRTELLARRASARRRLRFRRAGLGVVLLVAVTGATLALASETGSARAGRHGAPEARLQVSHAPASERRRVAQALNPFRYAFGLNPAQRVLGYTSYVRVGAPREREVALTFDDGPSRYTPKVLRILARTHAPATFFVIGEEARLHPRFVRDEVREGSEVGDHTENHPNMAELPWAAQQAQVVEAADAIHRAGAPLPNLWRPPYGSFNAETLAILRELGMVMVLWTVDTSDYALPGVRHIWYTALSGARPGGIILMHDGGGNRSETVAALPRIIAGLRRHGYRLVTVSQLLATDPPPHGQPPPQPLSGGG